MEGDITVIQLRQFGVPLEPSLTPADFTAELMFRSVLSALPRIGAMDEKYQKEKFPTSLPSDPTTRLTLFSTLLTFLQEAGCATAKHEHLMYPTEATTKPILSWLVSQLHRAADTAAAAEDLSEDVDDDAHSRLQRALTGFHRRVRRVAADGKKKPLAVGSRGRLVPLSVPQLERLRAPRRRAAVYTVPLVPWAEDPSANLVNQVESAFGSLFSLPVLPSEKRQWPHLGEVLLHSLVDCVALLRTTEKRFKAAVENRLDAGVREESLVAGGVRRWVKDPRTGSNQDCSSVGVDAHPALALEARFFNPSEDGLLGGDASSNEILQRRLREQELQDQAEMRALEEAVERKRAQAEAQASQREEDERMVAERLAAAKRVIRERKRRLKTIESEEVAVVQEHARVVTELEERLAALRQREEAVAEEEQLLALMDDASGSEARIRGDIEELKVQRQAHREELQERLQKVERKREELLEELARAGGNREELLTALRMKIKAVRRDLKEKQKDLRQLRKEMSTTQKDIDRTQFLTFIAEMTTNVIKQQRQIDEVRFDIADCDAAIDQVSERLRQYYSKLENRVYQVASAGGPSSPTAPSLAATKGATDGGDTAFYQQVYQALVDIRDAYRTLVTLIEDRGSVKGELREVEENIRKLQGELDAHDIEKVRNDLKALNDANEQLALKIEKTKSEEADGSDEP